MPVTLDKRGKIISKRNKYGVAPREDRMVDGIVFASKREATRYRELKLMQRCGDIDDLELQPRFKFPMGFSYVADFRYIEHYSESKRGRPVVVEDVKGAETAVFNLKRKCMVHFYPDVELRIVKSTTAS